MRHLASKIVFAMMLFLPMLLFVGTAMFGSGNVIQNRVLNHIHPLITSNNEVEVIFFGYVGCTYICPKSLFRLGRVLDSLRVQNPKMKAGGIFIDVHADSQIRRAEEYGLQFSPEIKGQNVDQETLNRYRETFGINVIDTKKPINEVLHTDHYFIVTRHSDIWKIAKTITNGVTDETLKVYIEQELNKALN